jgi:hypothetical protein
MAGAVRALEKSFARQATISSERVDLGADQVINFPTDRSENHPTDRYRINMFPSRGLNLAQMRVRGEMVAGYFRALR